MSYTIKRFYEDDRNSEIVQIGLTLKEAKAHCDDPETRGDGWFDGYEEEKIGKKVNRSAVPKVDPRFPDRPQHPDFWDLSKIVNELDDLAEAAGWLAAINTVPCDVRSMLYMGQQRAKMAIELMKDGPDGKPLSEEDRMGLLWSDAFAVGARYGMRHATVAQVLDESIDGNRRKG